MVETCVQIKRKDEVRVSLLIVQCLHSCMMKSRSIDPFFLFATRSFRHARRSAEGPTDHRSAMSARDTCGVRARINKYPIDEHIRYNGHIPMVYSLTLPNKEHRNTQDPNAMLNRKA